MNIKQWWKRPSVRLRRPPLIGLRFPVLDPLEKGVVCANRWVSIGMPGMRDTGLEIEVTMRGWREFSIPRGIPGNFGHLPDCGVFPGYSILQSSSFRISMRSGLPGTPHRFLSPWIWQSLGRMIIPRHSLGGFGIQHRDVLSMSPRTHRIHRTTTP